MKREAEQMNEVQKKINNMVNAFSESDMSDLEGVDVSHQAVQDCCEISNQTNASVVSIMDIRSSPTNPMDTVPKGSEEQSSSSDSDDLFFPAHKSMKKNTLSGSFTGGLYMWVHSEIESSLTTLIDDPILNEDTSSLSIVTPINKDTDGTTSDKPISIDESIIASSTVPTSYSLWPV